MRIISLIAAAAMAFTSTVGMAREGQQSFKHEGSTYIYTTKQSGDRQVIDGRRYPEGSAFHLVVRDGNVSGNSGGVPVSFKAARATGAVELAAR